MANEIEFILRAQDRTSGVMRRVGQSITSVVRFATRLATAIAAAGAAVVAFSVKISQAQDVLGKFAQRIGANITQLSKFSHAFELAGVNQNTFTLALQRMTRRIAEARQGMGEATGALSELNLSAERLSHLSPDQQFLKVATALDSVSNSGERVRLLFKFFDSEGVAVGQALQDGAEGFLAAAKEAERFGTVISERMARQAAEFQNNLTRVKAAFRGVGYTINREIMPVLNVLFVSFTNWLANNRERIGQWVANVIRGMLLVFEVTRETANAVKQAWSDAWELGDLNTVENVVKAYAASVFNIFIGLTDGIAKILHGTWNTAFTTLVTTAEWAGTAVWSFLRVGFMSLVKSIALGFRVMWIGFTETAQWAWDQITSIFSGEKVAGLAERIGQRITDAFMQTNQELNELRSQLRAGVPEFGQLLVDLNQRTAASRDMFFDGLRDVTIGYYQDLVGAGQEGLEALGVNLDDIALRVDATIERLKDSFGALPEAAAEAAEGSVERVKSAMEVMNESATEFLNNYGDTTRQVAENSFSLMQNTADAFGQAVGQSIAFGQNLAEAMQNLARQTLATLIGMLIKIMLQRKIASALVMKEEATQGSIELATGLASVYANSFASAAAIPVYGWAIAPSVAAGNLALASTGASAAQAIGASIGAAPAGLAGVAHDGLTNVPNEGTFLLQRNERVLSPDQNRDLTDFLNGNGRGAMHIENVNVTVLPNATNADALLRMTPEEMTRVVAGPIIRALNALDRDGVRPNFIESKS